MIRITCAKCNSKIKASETLAGKRASCPKCNSELSIPNINDADENAVDADGVYTAQLADTTDFGNVPSTPSALSLYPEDFAEFIPTAEYIEDAAPLIPIQETTHVAEYIEDAKPLAKTPPLQPSKSFATTASTSTSPHPRGLSKRPLLLLLATVIPTLIFLFFGLTSLFFFFNSADKEPTNTLQANTKASPPENPGKVTDNEENEVKRAFAEEEVNLPRSTVVAQTPLLRGDLVQPFTPSSTLKWIEYYNKARLSGDLTYVFLQSDKNGDTWMLGRRTTEKNAELTNVENAGVPTGKNFELLSYPATNDLPLEDSPVTIQYPDLLLNEYSTTEFRVKRLASIGFQRKVTQASEPSKNRSFAWSEDGNFLYVLQSTAFGNNDARHRCVLKINTHTWRIEAAAKFFAEDIAICSEGLVLSVKDTKRHFSGREHSPILSKNSFLFPLLSNFDTAHHLAILDPATLRLKYSYAMPEITYLAADPTSSRVFVCIYNSFLIEVDVKTNHLRRLEYRQNQCANLALSKEDSLLFSHNSAGKLTSFNLNSPDFAKSSELNGVSTWSTLSNRGKYLAANTDSEYQFYLSDDLVRPLASIPGPNLGMACIDDISNSALIAGIDSELNLTARLIQKNLDLTLILGKGKYLPTSPKNDGSQSIPPSYSQLSENVEKGVIPASWQSERSPFYLSSIPHGKGFLVFTFEGAFVIEPTKNESQFSMGQLQTNIIDVSSYLTDKSLRIAPVSSNKGLQITSVANPSGKVFGLPQGFVITDTDIAPESGDLYITAFHESKTASDDNGNWVLRVERDQLSKAESFTPTTTKLFSGKPNQYLKSSLVEYGGQKCLAVTLHSAVWFLDPAALEPIKFDNLPNPLDLTQPSYHSLLQLDPDTNYYIQVTNSTYEEQPVLAIGCWKEYQQWACGVFVHSQTGTVEGSVPLEQVAKLNDSNMTTTQRIADPYKQFDLFGDVLSRNFVQQKLDFHPRIILKKSPWIVGQKDYNLLFLSRYDLKDTHTIPLATALHFSFPAHNRLISESEMDNSLVISGPCASHLHDKMGSVFWLLPLLETNLPKRTVLATDLTFPTYNIPGDELTIPINGNNPNLQINIASAPRGVKLDNNTLQWTPTRDDVGIQDIELELTNQAEKVIEKHRMLVTPTLMHCGFWPRRIEVSNDGRYIAGSADNKLIVIDTVESKILSSTAFEQNVLAYSFVGSRLLVMLENDNYSIISITNPEQRINRTLQNQLSAQRGLPHVLHDKHLLLLADQRFESLPLKSISIVRSIPDLEESPLNKYLHPSYNAFGYFPESKEVLLGGVVLDANDNVTNVVSLDWSGIFCGNSRLYSVGIDGRHLTSSLATHTAEGTITLPDSSKLSMNVRAFHEPGYQFLEWQHELDSASDVFERFVVPTSYQFREHMQPEAALFGDKLYFTAGSYFSTVTIPESAQLAAAKSVKPLRIKPVNPITILDDSTKDIEFQIEGGHGPYSGDLVEKWHLFNEAIENTQNNDRTFYQLSIEGDKVVLSLDGAALIESLIQKPEQWLMASKFRIAENKDINDLAAELADYREHANESLTDIASTRFRGVPIGISLLLNIGDSDLQNTSLQHFVIIDFPAAQYNKLFREIVAKSRR